MCPVVFPAQSDSRDPLVNKASILACADVIGVIDSAWKDKVVERASAAIEPSEDTAAGGLEEFELDGPTGFLLSNDCPRANPAATDKFADFDLDHIASAKLAVDRQIEHRAVTQPALPIQPKPDSPNLLGFQSAFGANLSARVPWSQIFCARIIFGMSHDVLLFANSALQEIMTCGTWYQVP